MTMDFRSRTADVRREAADILWRFRSSRAARRNGTAPEAPAEGAERAGRPALPVSPATEELIRAARGAASPAPAVAGPDAADLTTGSGLVTEPAPAAEADLADPVPAPDDHAAPDESSPASDAPGTATAATGSPSDGADASGDAPGPVPDLQPETVAESPPLTTASAAEVPPVARDLTDLPGVGAGLVWLLGRCGVHTLADLARADAARLEQELGLVGQLLDLPSWIDLARRAVADERTPAP